MKQHFVFGLALLVTFSSYSMECEKKPEYEEKSEKKIESTIKKVIEGVSWTHEKPILLSKKLGLLYNEMIKYRQGVVDKDSFLRQIKKLKRRSKFLEKNPGDVFLSDIRASIFHTLYQRQAALTLFLAFASCNKKNVSVLLSEAIGLLDKADTYICSEYAKRDRGLIDLFQGIAHNDHSQIKKGIENCSIYLEKARNIYYRAHEDDKFAVQHIANCLKYITQESEKYKLTDAECGQAYYLLGLSLSFLSPLNQEAYNNITTAYTKAFEHKRPEALYDLGMINLRQEDTEAAALYFKQLCEISSQDENLNYKKAQAFWMRGIIKLLDKQLAMFDFNQAVAFAGNKLSTLFDDCYYDIDIETLSNISFYVATGYSTEAGKTQLSSNVDKAFEYYLLSRFLLNGHDATTQETGLNAMNCLVNIGYDKALMYIADLNETSSPYCRFLCMSRLIQSPAVDNKTKKQYQNVIENYACRGTWWAQALDLMTFEHLYDKEILEEMLNEQLKKYYQPGVFSDINKFYQEDKIIVNTVPEKLLQTIIRLSDTNIGAALFISRYHFACLLELLSNPSSASNLALAHIKPAEFYTNRAIYLLVQEKNPDLPQWKKYYGDFIDSLAQDAFKFRHVDHNYHISLFAQAMAFGNEHARLEIGYLLAAGQIPPQMFKQMYKKSLNASQLTQIGHYILKEAESTSDIELRNMALERLAAIQKDMSVNKRSIAHMSDEKMRSLINDMNEAIYQKIVNAMQKKTHIDKKSYEEIKSGNIAPALSQALAISGNSSPQFLAIDDKLQILIQFLKESETINFSFAALLAAIPQGNYTNSEHFKEYNELLQLNRPRSLFLRYTLATEQKPAELKKIAKMLWAGACKSDNKNAIGGTDFQAAFEIQRNYAPYEEFFKLIGQKEINKLREYTFNIQRKEGPSASEIKNCYYIGRVLVHSLVQEVQDRAKYAIIVAAKKNYVDACLYIIETDSSLFSMSTRCDMIKQKMNQQEYSAACVKTLHAMASQGILRAQYELLLHLPVMHQGQTGENSFKNGLKKFFDALPFAENEIYKYYDGDDNLLNALINQHSTIFTEVKERANSGDVGAHIFLMRLLLGAQNITFSQFSDLFKNIIKQFEQQPMTQHRDYLGYFCYKVASMVDEYEKSYWYIKAKKYGNFKADFPLARLLIEQSDEWQKINNDLQLNVTSEGDAIQYGVQWLHNQLAALKGKNDEMLLSKAISLKLINFYESQKNGQQIDYLLTHYPELALEKVIRLKREPDTSIHFDEFTSFEQNLL